jgi:hypothetical protein
VDEPTNKPTASQPTPDLQPADDAGGGSDASDVSDDVVREATAPMEPPPPGEATATDVRPPVKATQDELAAEAATEIMEATPAGPRPAATAGTDGPAPARSLADAPPAETAAPAAQLQDVPATQAVPTDGGAESSDPEAAAIPAGAGVGPSPALLESTPPEPAAPAHRDAEPAIAATGTVPPTTAGPGPGLRARLGGLLARVGGKRRALVVAAVLALWTGALFGGALIGELTEQNASPVEADETPPATNNDRSGTTGPDDTSADEGPGTTGDTAVEDTSPSTTAPPTTPQTTADDDQDADEAQPADDNEGQEPDRETTTTTAPDDTTTTTSSTETTTTTTTTTAPNGG